MNRQSAIAAKSSSRIAGGSGALIAAAALAGIGLLAARAADLHIVRTGTGPALVYTRRERAMPPVRVLRQSGAYQSATYLGARWTDLPFAYLRAFDALFDAARPVPGPTGRPLRDLLMIGGGGYAYPRHVLTERADVHLDVIEIDPEMERIARRWFYLDRLERVAGDRLRCIIDDGRTYLERTDQTYDVIINDCFEGRTPVRALATLEAARILRARLRVGGLIAMNISTEADGADVSFLRAMTATFEEVFAHVHILPATDGALSDEDSFLLIATDSEHDWEQAVRYDRSFPRSVLRD